MKFNMSNYDTSYDQVPSMKYNVNFNWNIMLNQR